MTMKDEILRLLKGGDKTGLELVKASTKLGRGTIYVILDQMEEQGLITSADTGDGRRRYSITMRGRAARAQITAELGVFVTA